MKHTVRTGRNILAVLLAVLMTLLTASVAATAVDVELLVVFENEYGTGSIDSATDLTTYAPVVMKSYSVESGVVFAKDAESAQEGELYYDGDAPVRRKDADFGEYEFAGWQKRTVSGYDTDGNPQYVYEDATFPCTITENTTFCAKFTGKAVTYHIDFRSDGVYVDADGKLQPEIIKVPVIDEATGEPKRDPYDNSIIYKDVVNDTPRPTIEVPYGGSVLDVEGGFVPANNPTREALDHYEFEFVGWDYDYTQIYKDGSINAVYNMVGKKYTFEFCDYDGTSLGERELVYGQPCTDVPAVAQTDFHTNDTNYSFHNQWNTEQRGLQTGTGEMISMSAITFQKATPDPKTKKIKVYAQYWEQLREIYFSLRLIDEDGEPAVDVAVQVAGQENQLLTTFTDASLGHNGGVGRTDDDGWVYLSVPYQESYTISAYDEYYNLAVQKTLTYYDIENNAQITLQLRAPYDLNNGQQYCNDVCHSFIGGLWITGLNLFYRLFKVKYVCCYDMYAVHGDRLVYASNSSGTTIDRS